MTVRKYAHAPHDAPLYRVPKVLGGGVWPAYRAWFEGNAAPGSLAVGERVVLDIAGHLVQFFADHLTPIEPPEGMHDWMVDILIAIDSYEDIHAHPEDGAICFAELWERIPDDTKAFIKTMREFKARHNEEPPF